MASKIASLSNINPGTLSVLIGLANFYENLIVKILSNKVRSPNT